MKSVERRFNNIAMKNPNWSSYVCFSEAVAGQQFSRGSISKYFNKLVEKDDYDSEDKKELLKGLNRITNRE